MFIRLATGHTDLENDVNYYSSKSPTFIPLQDWTNKPLSLALNMIYFVGRATVPAYIVQKIITLNCFAHLPRQRKILVPSLDQE